MRVIFYSDRLKRARMNKNMTQEDLAARCNTSDRYIRDLERGRKTHPSAEMLCMLAASLDITMEELVDVTQEDPI